MAKAKTAQQAKDAAEELALEDKREEALESAKPAKGLPVLGEGESERVLEKPLPVMISANRKFGDIIALKCREQLPGQVDGVKAAGETVYVVRRRDNTEIVGTFLASQLEDWPLPG